MAIRWDESYGVLSVLQVPLEEGHFYNPKAFAKAMQYLQRRVPSSSILLYLRPSRKAPSKPIKALTPIILSGLVATATMTQQQQQQQVSSTNKPFPTSTELVQYCHSRRRAAIHRIQLRHRRRKILRIVTPILLFIGMAITWKRTIIHLETLLQEWHFVDSCFAADMTTYRQACRLAEIAIWERLYPSNLFLLEDWTTTTIIQKGNIHLSKESTSSSFVSSFSHLALHHDAMTGTVTSIQTIPLEEITDGKAQNRRRTTKSHRTMHGSLLAFSQSQTATPFIGETMVQKLVRQALEEHISANTGSATATSASFKVLDVGCGVGGALYSLLQHPESPAVNTRAMVYHGIAISTPEIVQAQQLANYYRVPAPYYQFFKHSFDDPLSTLSTRSGSLLSNKKEDLYQAMIAIDSLSYSRNLVTTLANLAQSLQRGGILLVVDDVVAPWAAQLESMESLINSSARPSLVTHAEWKAALESTGFAIARVQDLGLELDLSLVLDVDDSSVRTIKREPFRERLVDRLVKHWNVSIPNVSSTNVTLTTTLKLVQLGQDWVQQSRVTRLRHEAYRRADLSYYMYVCIKR